MDIVVENFLAHYGVKGMQWGKRTSRGSSSSSRSSTAAKVGKLAVKYGTRVSPNTRKEALAAAKQVGKIAVRYGAPALAGVAVATVAVPLAPVAALSAKVLSDPMAQDAIRVGATASKELVSRLGSVPMSHLPKLSSPFSVRTTHGPSTVPSGSGQYINGEMPRYQKVPGGDLLPNPAYVGKK